MNYLAAVDDCFLDIPGGMGRVAWDVACAMRDRGHRAAMLCARPAGAEGKPEDQTVDGIRVVRYARPVLPPWHPFRGRRAIAAAAAAARSLGPNWDVVHMHSILTGAGVLDAFGDGPRYVYTMHSPAVAEQRINWAGGGAVGWAKRAVGLPALRRIEHAVLRRCAGIQALSQFTRSQIEATHGLGDRVTVIPHWRKPELQRRHDKIEARRKLRWPENETVLFTVRRHGPRYGLDVAIRAIAPAASAGHCRFVVGGVGPMRETLMALAKALGAGDRITFPGRLSDEDLQLAYEAADLFVLPTVSLECFGLITLEAFAFGCPVLSTDACAIPEMMNPIMPDFVVPCGDEGALRSKVEAFLDGRLVPPPPERLVAYVRENYDASVVLPRLAELLEGSTSS